MLTNKVHDDRMVKYYVNTGVLYLCGLLINGKIMNY